MSLPVAKTILTCTLLLAGGLEVAAARGARHAQSASQGAAQASPPKAEGAFANGASISRETGCEYCHGKGLSGTAKAPSLAGVSRRLTPEAIARQIHDGGGAMPAFGETLSETQIDDLVVYLSAFKKVPPRKHSVPKSSSVAPAPSPAGQKMHAVLATVPTVTE